MKDIIAFLSGKKTYIVAAVCIVYGVLAALGKAPTPEAVGDFLITVGAFAITFRAALQKLIDVFSELGSV